MDLPLYGKKILVTRAKEQADVFAQQLKKVGATPIVAPLLTIQPRLLTESNNVLDKLHDFTWVFFTSANGVKFFFKQLEWLAIPTTAVNHLHIAVVGEKTNKMLETFGFTADFTPEFFQGKKMVKEFFKEYSKEQQILLVCGNLSRDDIPNELQKHEVRFDRLDVYDTHINWEIQSQLEHVLLKESIDVFTFTSPSTIDAFETLTSHLSGDINRIKQTQLCLCIGTTTLERAKDVRFNHVRVPNEFTIDGMVQELITYFNEKVW
ncbi:uroporphyrinogen-III synthase [Aquibacillus albus]|uniref:Uroporphyrinogen-III synthase n=1 Tax=Aquibacillus albus TaxID=1168171 RepID=A0ABS2N1L5_9BACI|nr:uroporphyrinogen-III synthase [Aquibacillus albus]MBM7572008.1 uroporphyrinogen-III synthase [Aquibacillus albus]